MKPRILMLSLSRDLAEGSGASANEAQQRQRAYATFCDSVDVIVKAAPTAGKHAWQLACNLTVHVTSTVTNVGAAWRMLRLGARLIRDRRCTLIVAQEPFLTGIVGASLARWSGLPLCVHYVCDFLDNPQWLRERLVHRLLNGVGKFVVRRATVVRIDSPDQRERLLSIGVDPEAVHYVPFMQVGLEAFKDAERSAALREQLLEGGEELVLSVVRLDPQKDLDTLAAVAERVCRTRSGVRFVVVGDGPERHGFERLLQVRGLTNLVRVMGWVEFGRLPAYFASSDLFLLTSRYETSARVLVLARAAGLPVVTTDVSGAATLAPPEDGCAVAPIGDVERLAALVVDRLGRLADARRLARANRDALLAPFSETSVVVSMERFCAAAITRAKLRLPKLVYVLPKYDPATEEHFLHTYELLTAIAERVELTVIVERGAGKPRLGRANVLVQTWAEIPPLRLLEIIWLCFKLRLRSYRHFYVHYSYFGAWSAWIVTRCLGGHVYYWHCVSTFFRKRGWSAAAIRHRVAAEMPLSLTMRLVDYVVTGTASLADLYARSFSLPPSRIRVVPNEIRPERFRVAPEERGRRRRALNVTDEAVVLFVHRLAPRKGAHHLPAICQGVLRRRPNTRFVIVGDGPSGPELRRIVRTDPRLAGAVHLIGWIPNAEVPAWYAAADIFIMPSEEEGFPRVLLEAMAAGVPFVAADVGGVRDMCDPAQHWALVPQGDIGAFVERLTELIDDGGRRQGLIASGRARVQRYTVEAVADQTLVQLELTSASALTDAAVAPTVPTVKRL